MKTTKPDYKDSRYQLRRITNQDYEGGKVYDIKTYDDGIGLLYVLRDSLGITGVVRASSWEEAYEICEDEMYPEADETWEAIAKNLDCDPEELMDDACFQEQYGFRPNGPSVTDTLNHGLYMKDLNGDSLDTLTPALAQRLKLTIEWIDTEALA